MEILKTQSFEKRKEMLLAEMNFENKITVSSHFENNIMVFGICSNCLNNSNCVWMQTKKIECEEYI
jgi:hypothetical protein